MSRHLDWDGCYNTRDLGGLPTTDGRLTRRGSLVRSDSVHRLTASGWEALWAYGVRTVVDLRNDDEQWPDTAPRPAGLTTVRVPFADLGPELRKGTRHAELQGTPLCFRPFLDRFPDRTAQVFRALAEARPGGVLFHCVVGRDRTGLISLLLLALAGAGPETVADDYVLSTDRLGPLYAAVGEADPHVRLQGILEGARTTTAAAVAATLADLDPAAGLRAGGLSEAALQAVRRRLLG